MLHSRTTTNPRGTTSGHGSTSSKYHVFREAAPGAQIQGSCSLSRSQRCILFGFALWKGILELESEASAQQMMAGTPFHFGKGRLGQTALRTQWECHNRRTFT